ncbi:hypothetical protein XA68_16336 [Ophiocordyceps unilateralis]|uniref:Extracellular mutant protein 11 C-terminal domain-containing protein n=1 Tax=Ophiocordyceps unilateralis TaxID=268505 RepID=A0A2A9P6M7_OPHUN|nr:hypothetical protein XA68_16336 [Ophiocordyceps unilateralis]
MPPSLKEKSGRLQAFVRKDSDGAETMAQEFQTADMMRLEEAQLSSRSPTRQELADAARLSMPVALRNGRVSHRRQGSLAAGRTHPTSPQRAVNTARQGSGEVFTGSQLGDDFMNSGISTPQNEAESSEEGDATPNAKKTNQTRQDNTGRGIQNGPPPSAFRIEENLMMSIIPTKERRVLPHIMDGFHDDVVPAIKRTSYGPQQKRPSSTLLLRPELPTREVKVKRLPSNSRHVAHERREVTRSSSTDGTKWQGQRELSHVRPAGTVIELDDDLGSVSAHEESYPPPKPDNPKGVNRRPLGGSPVPANIALQKQPKERKRRRLSADYDDNMLSSMTFSDLQNEAFDVDPAKVSSQNGHDASAKLPLKLEQFRQQEEKEQKHMFESMSMDDWEASGDWFVEQFTDLMKRLREARRSKRRMIQAFEDEAARREEAVRHRSETIDRKLIKMRQDGQRVVEDRRA